MFEGFVTTYNCFNKKARLSSQFFYDPFKVFLLVLF